MTWRQHAACRGVAPALFFPERGDSPAGLDAAREVCQRCPVLAPCLAQAIDDNEWQGVWGGLSGRERRVLVRTVYADPATPTGTRPELVASVLGLLELVASARAEAA